MIIEQQSYTFLQGRKKEMEGNVKKVNVAWRISENPVDYNGVITGHWTTVLYRFRR